MVELTDAIIEQLANIAINEFKALEGLARLHSGQKVFKMSIMDTKITEAECTITKDRVVIKPEIGYIYRAALNIQNAQKKFGKLLYWIDMKVKSEEVGIKKHEELEKVITNPEQSILSSLSGDSAIQKDKSVNT